MERGVSVVEDARGLKLGTVTAAQAEGNSVLLRYDFNDLPDSSLKTLKLPFAVGIDSILRLRRSNFEQTADVEYKNDLKPFVGGEQLIVLSRDGEIAADAYRSGREPVALEVRAASLSARQIPGSETQLPVTVRVGSQTIQMSQGQVVQFGAIEVRVRLSSNRSGEGPRIEGAPYSLDLAIRPAPREAN